MPNKRIWADGPNGHTPINAARLNALETDLTTALDGVAALSEQVTGGIGSITTDPTYPGLYLLPDNSTVNPDPVNPGLYLIGD